MLWPIDQPPVEADHLGSLAPERVLFEFDGPRTFVARDRDGEILLLHQCGESTDQWRYFVVPFSESLLVQLEEGRLDLRAALDQPRLWIADLNAAGVASLFHIHDRRVVERYLPISGTMLFPDLEPLLSVRSLGEHVELGQATLGMLRTALDNVRGALKVLAEFATGEVRKRGQPSARTRRYYDLPALIQAGSVRVSVLPEGDTQQRLVETDDVWRRMKSTLQQGFVEAAKPSESVDVAGAMDAEVQVALRAVYLLAPPAYGAVEATEVSGRLAQMTGHEEAITITRHVGAALRQRLQLRAEHEPQIVSEAGFITELDREEGTCLLRDHSGATLRKLAFEPEFSDEVKEAFDSKRQVTIVAEWTHPSDTADLLALTFAPKEARAESNQKSGHG